MSFFPYGIVAVSDPGQGLSVQPGWAQTSSRARAWHGHQRFVLHTGLCPGWLFLQTSGLRSQLCGHPVPFLNKKRAGSWWSGSLSVPLAGRALEGLVT